MACKASTRPQPGSLTSSGTTSSFTSLQKPFSPQFYRPPYPFSLQTLPAVVPSSWNTALSSSLIPSHPCSHPSALLTLTCCWSSQLNVTLSGKIVFLNPSSKRLCVLNAQHGTHHSCHRLYIWLIAQCLFSVQGWDGIYPIHPCTGLCFWIIL